MEIEMSGHFHIILLDIELGEQMELKLHIKSGRMTYPAILFLSLLLNSIVKRQSVCILLHLLISLSYMRILISEAYEKLQMDENIDFMSNKTYFSINLNKIMYFMSEKRIINVFCVDKMYKFYGKMNDVEENIRGRHLEFWRIHRSFLVNPKYREEYHYDKVVLQNGTALEISRAKREQIRLLYMKKLGKLEEKN